MFYVGLNYLHFTRRSSLAISSCLSTRIAGGFLFRAFRPQLAQALTTRCPPRASWHLSSINQQCRFFFRIIIKYIDKLTS